MPKRRSKSSTLKKENDPLDGTSEISVKEEKIDEIKKEVLDLDIDIVPDSVSQLEIKKEVEDFPNDHFLIDPKDIPGIEKIINIEDILENKLNNTDSIDLISSNNTNKILQNTESSFSENSLVSKNTTPNCMQHLQYICTKCKVFWKYKTDKSKCFVCQTALNLKLECSKCKKKFKILSNIHQNLLQNSECLNLLSKENKEKFDLHFNSHRVVEKVKQNDHSSVCNQHNDDEFIEVYCSKCFKSKKNSPYDKEDIKYICEECQQYMLYRCVFCRKLYKSLLYIRLHLQTKCLRRLEHFKFHCAHCYFKNEDKSKLELHISLVHTPVTCEHCNKKFVNVGARNQHQTKGCPVEKSKKETDMCQSILKNVKTESTFPIPQYEEGTYKIVKNHPDILCDKICSKPPKDLYFSSCWQSMINYYCLLCDNEVTKKFSKYRPRCKTCKIKFEYRCKICQKIYSSHNSVANHVKSECPARYSFQCTLCNFTSTQKKNLVTHIRNKHTVFKCSQCESTYRGYWCLREHLLSNSICKIGNSKHLMKLIALYCKQCSKRLINVESLLLKPCVKCKLTMSYACMKCDQLFDDLETAHAHIKNVCNTHFHCTMCNYKSYTDHELNDHIKCTHTNDKICPDCGVQFRDEGIFKMHRFEEIRRKEERKKILCKWEAKRIKLSN